jgi:hypothetical protein
MTIRLAVLAVAAALLVAPTAPRARDSSDLEPGRIRTFDSRPLGPGWVAPPAVRPPSGTSTGTVARFPVNPWWIRLFAGR